MSIIERTGLFFKIVQKTALDYFVPNGYARWIMRRTSAIAVGHLVSHADAMPRPVPTGLRRVMPWIGTTIMAFLLFRLLFGHVYIMRGACECGHAQQWYEFNDRPYTIGIQISPQTIASGDAAHTHVYLEPTRARRY